ncbi:hypothetical protein EV132_13811 [Rhizobium sullae]|uniref:Uncharacterized protein n=1 Tax=Rhizobium sullae TaxID=50338 RepID=A0A4R3PQR0_RHISU|nr:hypothetical protein EV132_13811 [Rhizobium sullae]
MLGKPDNLNRKVEEVFRRDSQFCDHAANAPSVAERRFDKGLALSNTASMPIRYADSEDRCHVEL